MKQIEVGYERVSVDISGTPQQIMSMMKKVRQNTRLLGTCSGHDFQLITDAPVIPTATVRCVLCGGEATAVITEPPRCAIDELPPLRSLNKQ